VDPQEYDEIIRHLVRIAAHQDTINADQRVFNRQLIEINNDVKTTLARIETMSTVPRGEDSWQTQNNTVPSGADTRQTENETAPSVPTVGKEPTPVVQHSYQTVMSPESLGEPENASAALLHQPTKRTTRARLDAEDLANFDLEDMPLVPETASAALVRQPASEPAPAVDETRQTLCVPEIFLEPAEQSISQPASEQASPTPLAEQTPVDTEDTPLVVAPAFDPHKQMLGSPCKKAGHRSHGEAGNLRDIVSAACVACVTEKKAAKAKAKRQAQPA
jgi:hypothetical protein